MKRLAWLWLLAGLLVPALAAAATPVEASMVVTGTITVNPDGSVKDYTLRKVDRLPPAARHIVQATVPHWRFAPIVRGGKAITASAGMTLRIVADLASERAKQATLRIAGAAFGCEARPKSQLPGECPSGTTVMKSRQHSRLPRFPIDAMRAHVGGEVLAVLQVDKGGGVARAAVRQVNLYRRTDDAVHYRTLLAGATLRALRRWRFRVPTVGPNAAKNAWLIEVPVIFTLRQRDEAHPHGRFGHWSVYVPGPLRKVPWDHLRTAGASAVAGGAPFVRDTRFVLKTTLAAAVGQS